MCCDGEIVTHGSSGQPTCRQWLYEQAADVERTLLQGDADLPKIRIMYAPTADASFLTADVSSSLHSSKSLLPLEITESLMRKIMTRYKTDPSFLRVLFSFGEVPHLSESGSNNLSVTETKDGSCGEQKIHPKDERRPLTGHKICLIR